MWTVDIEKWVEPIERVWDCPVFAFHTEKGWLYGLESKRPDFALVIADFEAKKDVSPWTVREQGNVIFGIHKTGREANAILELIQSYMADSGSVRHSAGQMNRQRAFEVLAAGGQSADLDTAKSKFYRDNGTKVWVVIESDQAIADQMEVLIQNLGHEDLAVIHPNRLALMLHLKKGEPVLELIEGIHSLIEEELYTTVRIGVSEVFSHYDCIEDQINSAHLALNACGLTIDKRSWCFADRDLLVILLANPNHRSEIINAIDKRGLKSLLEDGELIYTLDCFLKANLNISEAAAKLFIHRNTLLYRLSKIEKLTGLDPRRFADAMDLFAMVSVEKVTHGV
jgi:hypothetical protein